jgi:uncharacterized protein (TIGR02266 family)
MIEKRKHSRVTISAEVNLSSEDNFYAGAARDISLGGLFVETEFSFPIGAEITVLLQLQGKALSLRAEVVWAVAKGAKTTGMGLRFLELPDGAKDDIEAFMKERQPIDFSVDDAKPMPPPLPESARRK